MTTRHRSLLPLLLLGAATLALPTGCKPAKDTPAPSAKTETGGRTHAGRLDWNAWQRWVPAPPRVVLVETIDSDTRELIKRQTQLFLAVTGQNPATAATLPETEIERLRNAFLASSSRTANSPVPTVERWDRYSNTVRRLQATSLPTTITTLEAYIRRDRQDLTPQSSSTGDVGRQARADLNWIDASVQPLLEKLKASAGTSGQTLTPDQARREWAGFETDHLPKIARAIDAETTAKTTLATDGGYQLSGRGQLVAIVTVAGRDLYFPAATPVPGLRFLQ